MSHKYAIFVCSTLMQEVTAALKDEGFTQVELIVQPCDCSQRLCEPSKFATLLRETSERFDHLLLLGGQCLRALQMQAKAAGYTNITFMESGFGLFLPRALIQKYQAEGAYLLTPGWLTAWAARMKNWGFDRQVGREFFEESCTRLVLLDTGTSERSADQLAAMAGFVDRPYEIVPVGLDMLRLALRNQLHDWNCAPPPPLVPQPSADYAMVFDVLSRLVGLESEEEVARTIFDLFNMLFAPGCVAYLPIIDGHPGRLLTASVQTLSERELARQLAALNKSYAWSETGTGFLVRMERNLETQGVLLVDEVALPQNKEAYLNLTLTILPVLGLAISSARNIDEREVLLREIHHRVKNNLNVVSSLLGLQAHNIKDAKLSEALRESQNRVFSMALIHEKLYQSQNLAEINFEQYISEFIPSLFDSYGTDRSQVAAKVDIHEVKFDIDTAIPCSLIINELVSNCLKYAFPKKQHGNISIEVHPSPADENWDYELVVADDGVGMPPGFDIERSSSLGLKLVKTLTRQIGGILAMESVNGTKFTIHFRSKKTNN